MWALNIKPTAKNMLIESIPFNLLVRAIKLSFRDVYFFQIVGSGVYFISDAGHIGNDKK
jgi:hypothetical protein